MSDQKTYLSLLNTKRTHNMRLMPACANLEHRWRTSTSITMSSGISMPVVVDSSAFITTCPSQNTPQGSRPGTHIQGKGTPTLIHRKSMQWTGRSKATPPGVNALTAGNDETRLKTCLFCLSAVNPRLVIEDKSCVLHQQTQQDSYRATNNSLVRWLI